MTASRFSLSTMFLFQALAGTMFLVFKLGGSAGVMVVLILFAFLGIPMLGTVWVAGNFQRVGSGESRPFWVYTGLGILTFAVLIVISELLW